MPYKSLAQMKFMHAKKPGIAKKWDKKYSAPKNLPDKLSAKEALKERVRG
jgi:hypothetical protein